MNHDSRHWRVDRVLANHSLGSTASQGTSNIPFPWFLLSQCNRQARNQERSTIMCLAEEHFSFPSPSSISTIIFSPWAREKESVTASMGEEKRRTAVRLERKGPISQARLLSSLPSSSPSPPRARGRRRRGRKGNRYLAGGSLAETI